MKRLRRTTKLLVLSGTALGSLPLAYGAWGVFGAVVSDGILPKVDESTKPACYLYEGSSKSKRYFSTIDRALDVMAANSTEDSLYVISGDASTTYAITKSHTIKAGDSLILPYDAEEHYWQDGSNDGNQEQEDSFKNPTKWRKLQVTLKDGLTLTNYGSIQIGGVQSGGNGSYNKSGQTGGAYAEIVLGSGSKLESYGVTNCYGYLSGTSVTSAAHFYSGSTTSGLYAIREHRGGSTFAGIKKDMKGSPFNRFYIANIKDINYRFDAGSSFVGKADLYANKSHNRTDISLIGSGTSPMLGLATGTYLLGRFDSTTYINTVETYGSLSLNPLELSITIADLSTADVLLPLSWYWNFTLHPFEDGSAASLDAQKQGLKMLPGSSLRIEEGVSVTLPKLAVYDTFNDVAVSTPTTYQSDGHNAPASLIVNGALKVTDSLGGFIQTEKAGATLDVPNNSITSYEIKSKSGSSFLTTVTWNSFSFDAKGYVDANKTVGTLSPNLLIESKGTYWHQSIHALSFKVAHNADYSNYDDQPFRYILKTSYNGTEETHVIDNDNRGPFYLHEGTTYSLTEEVAAGSISSMSGTVDKDFEISIQALKGSLVHFLTINLDGAEVELTYNDKKQTFNSNGTARIPENVTVSYKVNYLKSSSKTTELILPDGSKSSAASGSFVMSGNASLKASSTCILEGTRITMADGSCKKVEDIRSGDLVLAYNHFEGCLEAAPVVFNDAEEEGVYSLIHLTFEKEEIDICYEHAFFDLDLGRYVYIREENYRDYIGHRFVRIKDGAVEATRLVKARVYEKRCRVYGIVTEKLYNAINENLLSNEGNTEAFINQFAFEKETLRYDREAMEKDLATYGRFAYEDMGGLFTPSMFECFNLAYAKVSIGKGLLSFEDLRALDARYTPIYKKQTGREN